MLRFDQNGNKRNFHSFEIYKKIYPYIKPYFKRLILALICMVLVAILTAVSRWLIKPVLDKIFLSKDIKTLYLIIAAVPVLFIFRGVFWYAQVYFMTYISQNVIRKIRDQLFQHLQILTLDYYHRNSTGKIMATLIDYIHHLEYAIVNVPINIVCNGLTIIALFFLLFFLNWKLTLLSLIVFPFAAFAIYKFATRLKILSKNIQDQIVELYSKLQETIAGVLIVKAFSREKHEVKRFEKLNLGFYNLIMSLTKTNALSSPLMEVFGAFGIAFILYFGGRDVIGGFWTTGSFFAFLAAALSFYQPLRDMAQINSIIQQGITAAERIFTTLEETPSIYQKEDAYEIKSFEKEITFENVSFVYPNTNEVVLENISLKIKPKEVLAIVGPSGVGKTSLVLLLLRFYEPTSGKIKIDGIDLKDISLESYRRLIGLVSQDVFLFNDTIRYNIAYGCDTATNEDVIEAAKIANAHNFISKLPSGYETVVGERGVKLSGGEKQRIAIARAVIRKPQIIIFDEATGALDAESERLIQDSIEKIMVNSCVIIISHRFFTIKKAKRVIVIEDKKIVEDGTQEDLFQKDGIYRRLHRLQFI